MAHYAFLDRDNIVTNVIVGKDEEPGIDWEKEYGQLFNQVCKKTSYNTYAGKHKLGGTPFRKNYAGIGFSYNEALDAFIPPKPYPSWILDEETCTWRAPVPKPEDTSEYSWVWSEDVQNWIKLVELPVNLMKDILL